ncbi:MAG: TonB-dependent receptor [Gemmatimonadota bacterium]
MSRASRVGTLMLALSLGVGPGPVAAAEGVAPGAVRGRVLDGATRQPLPGAVVAVAGTRLGAWADETGAYRVDGVPAGGHTVEATHVGYRTVQREVAVPAGGEVVLDLALEPEAIRLSAVTVTPSRFAIMGGEPQSRQTLTEEQIQAMPHFGEDIYRAVTRLPGVSGSDFSAKFTVRGGEHDEVLALFDGVQLIEPFHLRDIDGGALSIVDVEVIEGIDLLTGAYTAEYGDRTSGVFNIRSRTPEPGSGRHSVGLSFMNARAQSEGTFERGSWLVSARRGYLDVVMRLMNEDEDIDPSYYDVLAKVEYQLNDRHRAAAHLLHADDHFDLVEADGDDSDTGYGNSYAWLNLVSTLSPRISARTTLSLGRVASDRDGNGVMDDRVTPDFGIHDRRRFHALGLKQDWSWERSERHYLKWGVDAKALRAEYDYLSTDTDPFWPEGQGLVWRTDTTAVARTPRGHSLGVYGADRFRLGEGVTAEAGLRYDRASHTGDDVLSPRLNLAWSPDETTAWRAGWGRYYQSQGIQEMAIQDGDSTFSGAERAEHRVLSLERHLDADTQVRVELYWKKLVDQRPAYRNIRHDIEMFPELIDDRVRVDLESTTARGLALYARRDRGARLTWWASYAWARVRERVASVENQYGTLALGRSLPGLYDQRHTLYVDVNYRPSPRWHLNVAWQYHSGWPYTDVVLKHDTGPQGVYYWSEWGPAQAARFPAFHRLDLRLSRRFRTARGEVTAYAELVNVYNQGNIQTYNYWWMDDGGGGYYLRKVPDYWFRLLPSLGVSWSWGS